MPAAWVMAGTAALGAVQSIMGNSAASKTNAINNQIAQQNANAQGTMLSKASDIANTPFTAYTGNLTAPMSGNEQLGYDQAASAASPNGPAATDMTSANNLVDQVAGNSNWNSATADKYMNPYTQAVTDQALNAANRDYEQNLTSMNERAAQTGAFGGGRNAIQQGELAGQNQLNLGNITATGNANAYDSAMRAWNMDNAAKLNAANAYEKAGGDITKMNGADISNLMKTGGVSRAVSQTGLNNAYGQFMRQQNWQANQLQPLMEAMGKTQGGVRQTAPVQSNTANQLLGLASTIGGLFGSGSSPGGGTSAADSAASGISDIGGGGSALSSSYFDPSQLTYSGGAMDASGMSPFSG